MHMHDKWLIFSDLFLKIHTLVTYYLKHTKSPNQKYPARAFVVQFIEKALILYTFISDSRRRILPAGMPNIILKRRQK
jgi:hypothetical protein